MTAILKLMAALVDALVRFAPLFLAWRAGRRAAQALQAQTGVDHARQALRFDEAVAGLSDRDLERELRQPPT